MTRVQLKRVNYNDGDIHRIDDVVEMEANQAAYALGMGDVIASGAGVSTPVTFPPRINNSPGARGQSKAEALLDLYGIIHGVAMSAADDSLVIRDTVTPANNFKGRLTSKLLRTGGGTMWDVNGQLIWTPENQLTRSQELDLWSTDHSGAVIPVVTANAGLAPDGTMTADRVQFNKTGGIFSRIFRQPEGLTANVGQRVTFSVWIKRFTATAMNLTLRLGDGSIGSGAVALSPTDEWVRYSVTHLITAAAHNAEILVWDSAAANTETADVLVWGAMYDRHPTVREYRPTTSTGFYAARISYDPANDNQPGLLDEPQSINTSLHSNNFNDVVWVNAGASLTKTPNSAVGPDGLSSMYLIADNDVISANYGIRQNGIVLTASVPNTASIFIKKKDYRYIQLNFTANVSGAHIGYFDLDTGVVSGLTSATGKMVLKDGIWRLEITFTASATDATSTLYIIYTDSNATSVHTGVVGKGTYFFGTMVEAQPQATSYIPTGATAVTRTADVLSLLTSLFSWGSILAGSVAIKYVPLNTDIGSNKYLWSLADGTTNNRICSFYGGPQASYRVTSGGSSSVSGIGSQSQIARVKNRLATAWAANDFASYLNGVSDLTSQTVTPPTGLTTLGIGLGETGAQQGNILINELICTPTRISNDQLQRLAA